jgi:hexosaminidase
VSKHRSGRKRSPRGPTWTTCCPRLIGIAEIGWSRKTGRNWNEYRVRLGAQAARLAALGIDFYRSPEIPWR